jgi:hypothetical protein
LDGSTHAPDVAHLAASVGSRGLLGGFGLWHGDQINAGWELTISNRCDIGEANERVLTLRSDEGAQQISRVATITAMVTPAREVKTDAHASDG